MTTDVLTALASKHGTDKWGVHHYTPLYERHLGHLREQPIKLLELGVGGYGETTQGGESLRMWKEYFPLGEIVGLDIFDKSALAEERITIVQGAQDDPKVTSYLGTLGPYDVIVDDCSHQMGPTIRSFEQLFGYVKPGGWYVIEDLQTSYWRDWGGSESGISNGTVMNYLLDRVNLLNHKEFRYEYEPSFLDQEVVGMAFYRSICFLERGR